MRKSAVRPIPCFSKSSGSKLKRGERNVQPRPIEAKPGQFISCSDDTSASFKKPAPTSHLQAMMQHFDVDVEAILCPKAQARHRLMELVQCVCMAASPSFKTKTRPAFRPDALWGFGGGDGSMVQASCLRSQPGGLNHINNGSDPSCRGLRRARRCSRPGLCSGR